MQIFLGFMLPFIGTLLGSACVFLLKEEMNLLLQKVLLGFASGVMVAASVWSLLIPAMDLAEDLGSPVFVPASFGLLLGMFFLLLMDRTVPHLHLDSDLPEGPERSLRKNTMLFFAVTLHNIPEGMAVGVIFAGMLSENTGITMASAITLALGIAIQNFPEGAIISMPMRSSGEMKRTKAFFYGAVSGIVEPVSAALTLVITHLIEPALPYILSFAAGAMLYVVIEELIPEASRGKHSNMATVGFALGFVIMMILDVVLG